MTRWLSALVIAGGLCATPGLAKGGGHGRSKSGSVHVHGYTKKNGTYVPPHHRSPANGTKNDNWSTKGNINPYTGVEGTKDP